VFPQTGKAAHGFVNVFMPADIREKAAGPPFLLKPNARPELRLEAGARHEHTLKVVGSRLLFVTHVLL
jgi:hypothetical protein